MKKETLLSLLMTAPVAFPALADVNLQGLTLPGEDGANWKSEASSFIDGYKADGAGMYCPVGIKSISRVLTLPQGKYKISLAGNNNAKLEITGATAELNSKKEVLFRFRHHTEVLKTRLPPQRLSTMRRRPSTRCLLKSLPPRLK